LHLGPLTAQARPASHKATQGGFLLSQKTVSVRIPRITPAGVTRYRSADSVKDKIGACPDFPLALVSQRLPNAGKHYRIIRVFDKYKNLGIILAGQPRTERKV